MSGRQRVELLHAADVREARKAAVEFDVRAVVGVSKCALRVTDERGQACASANADDALHASGAWEVRYEHSTERFMPLPPLWPHVKGVAVRR